MRQTPAHFKKTQIIRTIPINNTQINQLGAAAISASVNEAAPILF